MSIKKLHSQQRFTLNKKDITNFEKVAEFVVWWIKNEPIASVISGRSSNIIFNEGYRPKLVNQNNPELVRQDINSLAKWFIVKVFIDLNILEDVAKDEFMKFIDILDEASEETLITAGNMGIKYDINFDNFVYEKEIEKISEESERNLFKANFLSDNVLAAEIRILAWLYYNYFGEWYQLRHKRHMIKVAMFEDDALLREIYQKIFKENNLQLIWFSSPPDNVVEKIAEIKPDLISMSVVMPGMDGFSAAKLLKSDPKTKNIPLVFFTTCGQKEDIETGHRLGAVDYFVKSRWAPSEIITRFIEIIKQGNNYKPHQVEFKQGLKNRIKKIFKTGAGDKRLPLVLLIENDEFLVKMYTTKLQQEGLDVKISRDGEDGLRQAKELLPDIILLGLILPKMDGFKVMEELKKDPILSKIPIIKLSMIEQRKEISGKEMYDQLAAHMPSEVVKRAKQIVLEQKNK